MRHWTAVDVLSYTEAKEVAEIITEGEIKGTTDNDKDTLIHEMVHKFEEEGIFESGGISVDPMKDEFKLAITRIPRAGLLKAR